VLTAGAAESANHPGHDICAGVASYSGSALRASPVDVVTLEPSRRSNNLTDVQRAALAAAFDKAQAATGAPSMTAALWRGDGALWQASHGTPPGYLHYWASVGKLVTAAAVLRLEADGRLSLDDPIADYVAGVPNGDLITLRMLINHTSGLFSANEDPEVRARTEPLGLDGVLEVVRRRPPYACPGAAWRYSNSGYSLLGAVIEAVTRQPYHLAVRELVLSRSAALPIRVLGPDEALDGIVVPERVSGEPYVDPRAPQAAGGLVADAESMVVFMRDLMAGRILPRETVAGMLSELYPMQQPGLWYGLGLMVYDVPGTDGTSVWIGHSGGTPGVRAVVAFAPEREAIAAVALIGQGSAEATANLLLQALE
jgi:D-alanyl-D-alanine carboxypeptidase